MKIRNDSGLPDHLYAVLKSAYENDLYNHVPGEKWLSVTQLIAPAQKLVLEKQHAADLEMDVLDTIPALLGQALHHILERAGPAAPTHVPERRLEVVHDGWTISGKADLYETKEGIIVDYKNSSVWTYIYGKKEWSQQLNVYRWLSERNGFPVKGLAIALFCGDWRRGEAKRSADYPARVVNIPVQMWTMDEATAFIDGRLKLHREAREGKEVKCSSDETWAKPATFAVMKPGRKTAVSVHDNITAAENAANGTNYVQARPGESVRCTQYCQARPWCPQAAADPTLQPVDEGTLTHV